MADIMRPQIIDISTGKVTERLDVYDASLTLCTDASSSANIRIDEGRSIDSLTYIRMYTIQGFAGIFRTRAPVRGIGGQTSTLQMEQAVNALGDVLVKETIEKEMTVKAAGDLIGESLDGGGTLEAIIDLCADGLREAGFFGAARE